MDRRKKDLWRKDSKFDEGFTIFICDVYASNTDQTSYLCHAAM